MYVLLKIHKFQYSATVMHGIMMNSGIVWVFSSSVFFQNASVLLNVSFSTEKN